MWFYYIQRQTQLGLLEISQFGKISIKMVSCDFCGTLERNLTSQSCMRQNSKQKQKKKG